MEHHAHQPTALVAGWGVAASATLHCLTGCAIGEVLGMVIGTSLGWGNLATIVLAVVLAFVFGYAFTLVGVLRPVSALPRRSRSHWWPTRCRSR